MPTSMHTEARLVRALRRELRRCLTLVGVTPRTDRERGHAEALQHVQTWLRCYLPPPGRRPRSTR